MHIAAHSRGLIDAGVPLEIFAEFIEGVREQYTAATYNLATNNCNHFSNAVAEFLVGVQVPTAARLIEYGCSPDHIGLQRMAHRVAELLVGVQVPPPMATHSNLNPSPSRNPNLRPSSRTRWELRPFLTPTLTLTPRAGARAHPHSARADHGDPDGPGEPTPEPKPKPKPNPNPNHGPGLQERT